MLKKILSVSPLMLLSAFVLATLLALTPALVNAGTSFGGIGNFVDEIISFINDTLVPLVFAIAFLVFLWGVFMYFILGGADEDKRASGRQLMLYAIIGFVLMVSIWGIVNIVSEGLGFRSEQIQAIPNAPRNNP